MPDVRGDSTRIVSTALAGIAAVALTTSLTGCGGHKDRLAALQRKQQCLFLAEYGAETNAVRALIARGAISKADIPKHFPRSLSKRRYLDAGGNLLPYGRLKGLALASYDDWLNSLERRSGFGTHLLDVQRRARDAAAKPCSNVR